MTDEVADTISHGDHGSTFGGGPVAASAALAVLERIQTAVMLDHIRDAGGYLNQRLDTQNLAHIVGVRSLGLMVGIELDTEAKPYYEKAPRYGILILTAGQNVIRLLPPLTITKDEINIFMRAFKKLLSENG